MLFVVSVHMYYLERPVDILDSESSVAMLDSERSVDV
jgi:hypothetical protein